MMTLTIIRKISLSICSLVLVGLPVLLYASETTTPQSLTSLVFKEQKRYPVGVQNEWKRTFLTGKHIEHAEVIFYEYERPNISIRFNRRGKRLFQIITARNIGKPLGIFVNGSLISDPIVYQEIAGGVAVIAGYFTKEEAEKLAHDLNNL